MKSRLLFTLRDVYSIGLIWVLGVGLRLRGLFRYSIGLIAFGV